MPRQMLTLETRLTVDGLAAADVFEFLVDPSDRAYQRWWPGVHLQLHPVAHRARGVGDLIYMDEYVGDRRVRMQAIVVEAERPRRLVWQFKKVIRLPARLVLELSDAEGGVAITHRLEAGSPGAGRMLDPMLRLYFSRSFAAALEDHARTEFPLFRDRLDGILAEQRERR